MVLLFWLSIGFVFYVYVGYPLLLLVWSRIGADFGFHTPSSAICNALSAMSDDDLPGVSIVIAARNEAHRLRARIENLLTLDFPVEKRQIIVVLDGSTDDSLEILEQYFFSVDVVTVPSGGKAGALNAGVAVADHDILVFADARQLFAPDALRQLVVPFCDASIGGVTGELVLDAEAVLFSNRRSHGERRLGQRPAPDRRQPLSSTIADGVGLYWRYEKALRRLESTVGSTLGATGAIYAIRRSLWADLPADTLLDDVLTPMRVVLQGRRVVFNDRARAFDRAAADADAEARRKVRTLAGNYQLLAQEPRLLLPWCNRVWLQFVSHKIGRLLVPYALLTLFATSIALSAYPAYFAALSAQVCFYLLAGHGALLELAARRKNEQVAAGAGRMGRETSRERSAPDAARRRTPVREVA